MAMVALLYSSTSSIGQPSTIFWGWPGAFFSWSLIVLNLLFCFSPHPKRVQDFLLVNYRAPDPILWLEFINFPFWKDGKKKTEQDSMQVNIDTTWNKTWGLSQARRAIVMIYRKAGETKKMTGMMGVWAEWRGPILGITEHGGRCIDWVGIESFAVF